MHLFIAFLYMPYTIGYQFDSFNLSLGLFFPLPLLGTALPLIFFSIMSIVNSSGEILKIRRHISIECRNFGPLFLVSFYIAKRLESWLKYWNVIFPSFEIWSWQPTFLWTMIEYPLMSFFKFPSDQLRGLWLIKFPLAYFFSVIS